MNILVLTARFGMGHYKVAEAIKENIECRNADANVKIVDFMNYLFPKTSKFIYGGYNALVFKNARLYNAIGKFAGHGDAVPFRFMIAAKIKKLILENEADAIVVAFPLCSQYVSAFKDYSGCDVPMYTCVTDIPVHKDWIADNTEMYFVSSNESKEMMLEKGVDKSKIIVTGIPVRTDFSNGRALKPVHENKKNLVVMGGGLGLIPGSDLLLNRLAGMDNVNVTVITGNNNKLFETISSNYPKFKTLGFVDNMSEYMKKADAVITKPGGVTLFEAINTQTPLYVVNPFLLQEIGNARFIEDHGIGRVVWKEKDATPDDIEEFISNTEKLDEMKKIMLKICKANSKYDIMTEIITQEEEKAV